MTDDEAEAGAKAESRHARPGGGPKASRASGGGGAPKAPLQSPPPLPDGPCPITPLGTYKGHYYFFDTVGQIIELSAQALGQSSQIVSLFGGSENLPWCCARWPHWDRDGNLTGWFNVRNANADLVQQCNNAGIFERTEPERGHGVWIAQGLIAVHLGNRVRFHAADGTLQEERPAGLRARGALWPAHGALPPPALPADTDLAAEVESIFRRWTWGRAGEERAFTGLYAAGLMGAAIRWRPHGLVVGAPGSGKTTLMNLYAALSPLAIALNDYTESGIRQLLTGRAAPLVLDEADEGPETMDRLQRTVGLLRRASGGDGAQVVRGSVAGKAQRYDVTSPALLGAVLPPPLAPQDATRITRLDLCAIPEGTVSLPVDRMLAWARQHAPAFWGRAISGIPRFNANLDVVRRLLATRGCSPRLSDQVGTIIAARAMFLEDEPLDDYAAGEDIEALSWLAVRQRDDLHDAGPMRCLQHLLGSAADAMPAPRPTFGRLIARAAGPEASDDARRGLVDHGLCLTPWPRGHPGGPVHLLVATSHPQLARVFHGTGWAGNRWTEDLRRLPDVLVPQNPVKFAYGLKPRCVAIPAKHWADHIDGDGSALP